MLPLPSLMRTARNSARSPDAWNSIARAALLLCRLKQQQSGKRLGAMSYLAEFLLNALMLFAVELGRVRRRGRRRRLGLNDAVWQGIGLI